MIGTPPQGHWTRLALLAIIVLTVRGTLHAQCGNDNILTGATISPACPGTITVPCVQGGQYALVNVTLGNIYTFSTCTSAAFDTQITLYNNTGGASLGYNDDLCGNGLQSSVQWTATFSGQLRVLVDQYNCATNAICIPLTVTCAAPPPPVTNNNPCQAIAVPVTTTCVNSTYSNVGANLTTSPVVPAPGCGNLVAGSADVWFSFVAPPTGIAIIETGAGTLTDGAMALYTATACGGTYNLVQCDDDNGPGLMPFLTFNNLTPGQTYYLRVWGFGAATGSFTLCIHGPTALPAGNCVYMLELFDGFGDGWGGSTVTVSLNGTPVGTYTCNTLYNVFLIGVNIGQVLVVSYAVNGGPFQGENLYTLSFLSTSQVVFNSGSPPAAGANVYNTTITCNPPPAAPEDCVGGATLCNGQGINNNTNSTGSVADLDPSNYGCLLAAEQQGTWYNFVVSSGGTLGMSIDPSGADDYDWAIWGPFPPGSTTAGICPPLGSPIRCSFASGLESLLATGDYTTGMGVNNLAWASPQYAPVLPIWSDPAGGGDGWTPGINVVAGQVYLLYISNFSLSGQAFNLSWQLGSGASLDCTVLPVELLTFGADDLGMSVAVHWSTASEHDASHYDVQRSADGLLFDHLGRVEATGNSATTSDYAFRDSAPLPGVNYYRLAQSDIDGHLAFSGIAAVDRTGYPLAGPFPNPVGDMAWWALPEGHLATDVAVFDALGHTLLRVPLGLDDLTLVAIPTGQLPRGAYSVAALGQDGSTIARSTFVKY